VKVAVCVKHAVDETELKIDSAGRPLLSGAASKMSTFDKNAVEEALRLRTSNQGEVVAFTVGNQDAKKTLKEALAMGADRGVLVSDAPSSFDSLRTAEVLAAAVRKEGPFDVVVCSEGSSDTYTGQVPPMLGELLGFPYIGYARKLEVAGSVVKADRSLEDSVETVEAPVPCVVSVVSEINEPRYPTLIQIMQASKKPLEELSGEQLAPQEKRQAPSILSVSAQPSNRKRVIFEGGVDEAATKLVDALLKEGVLTK
jgi:electron transfer flavoprotein beta subunit